MKAIPLLALAASIISTALAESTAPSPYASAKIETFAGTGQAGYSGDGGPAVSAQLNNPFGVVRGPDQALYICDTGNHVIRRIDTNGVITTVAGTGQPGYSGDDGPSVSARLNEPYEIRFDTQGHMFFVEMRNHVVRRVNAETGLITTVAGTGERGFGGVNGPAIAATFSQPHSIQFGPDGFLYICDIGNHRIRRVDLSTGMVRTFAGTGGRGETPNGGKLPNLPLNGPRAIDFDRNGDLWLALREGNAIYRIDMKHGTIHHAAGTGAKGFSPKPTPALASALSGPKGISIATDGTVVFADTESHSIRALSADGSMVFTIAGTGEPGDGPSGLATQGQLKRPHGVFVDTNGDIFVGDSETHQVRRIPFSRPIPE